MKMTDSDRGRRQINFGKQIPRKLLIFGGDCSRVNKFLEGKSEKTIFGFLHYLNALFRSFGHTVFANNPISGLVIMIAVGSASYKAMFASIFASSLSFLFAKVTRQDILGNLNGFFSYNAVLHAVASVGCLPARYKALSLDEPRFWLFLFFVSLISVYFTSAFANLFRYLCHYPIPCFTIPFNLLQYVLIFCLLNNAVPSKVLSPYFLEPAVKSWNNDSSGVIPLAPRNKTLMADFDDSLRKKRDVNGVLNDSNEKLMEDQIWTNHTGKFFPEDISKGEEILQENENSTSDDVHLDWGKTFAGTITALSQVYGLNDIPCSVLILLALLIYSPTTAFFCYSGSFVGTILGIFLASDYQKVYTGTWGYNGLLCGGALGGFGFVLTYQSAFLTFIAVVFSTVFQHFITPLFDAINVPIFHIPFLTTTIIFLLVTTEGEKDLPRPGNYTYPEKHRREFMVRRGEGEEQVLRRGGEGSRENLSY